MNLSYLLPMLEYLKSVVRSSSFKNVRNKNGCVVSSTGKVDLSFGFNPIQAGGGGGTLCPPTSFFPAVPKRFLVD